MPLLVVVAPALAWAQPLGIVSVKAPAINCVFDPSCKVVVKDTSGPITLAGAAGKGFLQSRTYQGKPGAPGNGKHVYLYRIDLRQAYGIVNAPCVSTFAITFGPVVATLDYDKSGAPDHVFVVTAGGLGSVGPKTATRSADVITFAFNPPVCVGGSPGKGESTYFFGLAASTAPHAVTATLTETGGKGHGIPARAPTLGSKNPPQ
jgi:hypothetical protein